MAEAASAPYDWSKIKMQLPTATYQQLPRVTAPKYSQGLAVSAKKFAYCATEREVAILPFNVAEGSKEVERAGRAGGYGATAYAVKDDVYHIKSGKASSFTDFTFDQFDSLMLYTSHTNGAVKGWIIPDKMSENLSTPKFTVEGVGATINSLTTSDAVSDLIAANSQDLLACIAPSKGKVVAHWDLDGKKDQLYSSAFATNSSVMRACCSNKTVYTVDVRQAKKAASLDVTIAPRTIFTMDSSDKFLLIGQDSFGRIQSEMWDPRNTSERIWKSRLGKLNGDTLSYYDVDTKLLYVGSRLAATYNLYDMAPTLRGKDFDLLLEESLGKPCYGFAGTPRFKIGIREAVRCNVLHEDGILPVQTVLNTQLFENCVAPTAAINSEDWMSGKDATRVPCCHRVKKLKDLTKKKTVKSKIQNVLVVEPNKIQNNLMYNSIDIDRKGMVGNYNLRMNEEFMAFPLKTGAGCALGIVRHSGVGDRFEKIIAIRGGHKMQVSTFDVSMHQQTLVATGSDDGMVYLWEVKDDVKRPCTIKEPKTEIQCWERVRIVRFHPQVSGILIVCDFNPHFEITESRIRIFDVSDICNPKVIRETKIPDNFKVTDLDIDPSGTRAVISTQGSKNEDAFARVYNLQSGKFEAEFQPEQRRRTLDVRWLSENEIVTAGHNMGNKRSISLWDRNKLDKEVYLQIVDTSAGAVLIHVDTYHRLIYFSGIGQTRVRTFEVFEDHIYPHGKSHMCVDDAYGMCWWPKLLADVHTCELNKMMKLGRNNIVSVSFQLMRKRKEFFQDDVYMKVRPITSKTSAKDWSGGASLNDELISLQPEDMTPLSLAPAEAETPGARNARRRRSDAAMGKMTSLSSSVMSSDDSAKKLLDSVKVVQNASEWAPGIGQWVVEAEDGGVDEDEWSD